MECAKSLLINGDRIEDITHCITTIQAHDKETGKVQFSGCGIEVFRPNHISGDACIFLSYQGEEFIFGEHVDVYTHFTKWIGEYCKYDMKPFGTNHIKSTVDCNTLRKLFIIE
jgi:hypothetical protein